MKILKILGIAFAAFFALLVTIGLAMPDEYLYDDDYTYYDENFDGYEEAIMEYAENMENPQNQNYSRTANYQEVQNHPRQNQNGTIMHPQVDPKTGQVVNYIPLPATWKVNGSDITGPNGEKIAGMDGEKLNGGQVVSIDQLIQNRVIPKMKSDGVNVLNVVDLPSIASCNQRNFGSMYKSVPTQSRYFAKGIEYALRGKKGITVVNYTINQSQYGTNGFYYYSGVYSDPQDYNAAKQIFIYAMSNTKMGDQYMAQMDQNGRNRSRSAANAHASRMASREAAFRNSQIAAKNNSDILDIQMDTWRNNNITKDRMHDREINAIHGWDNRVDPNNGRTYKVDHGYQYYFMNGNGEYIGSNDPSFDPRYHPNYSHQNWRKAQKPGR